VLFKAGDQVPIIASFEVVGNADKDPPEQISATCVKAGVAPVFTVMVIVVVVAHCPASGVNVYVVVLVLFKAGDHDPVIPLSEVVGKADNAAPEQIAATCVKVGVTLELTVMVIVVVFAH
jgi:hypothetical protein